MQAIVRTYTGHGAKELFDVLEREKADVEKVLRAVQGFVSYTLVRTADGGFAVTVCRDSAGVDESVRVAGDWVAKHAGGTGAAPPKVSQGSVILDLH